MKKLILINYIFLFLLLSCNADEKIKLETINLKINNNAIEVYVAKDKESRSKGLMNVESLEKDGMIFAYQSDSKMSFWMKNTILPLSIAFISSSGKIKEIYNMEPFSLESVKSKYSVRYALEVQEGFFEKNSIKVGDIFVIPQIENIE